MSKKIAWTLLTLTLFAALCGGSVYAQQDPEWTIMFYMAGGIDAAGDARKCLFQMKDVGSSPKMILFVQFDTGSDGTETKQYKLTTLKNATKIRELVENIKLQNLRATQEDLLHGILGLPSTDEALIRTLLNSVEVKVGTNEMPLGQVLDQVLDTPKAKEYFRLKLKSEPARLKAAQDPDWLKELSS